MQRQTEYIEKRIHGREAFEAVGMPHEFAAQLMLLADQLGVTIAMRASEPEQLYSQSAQPKQSSVKQKSGDWGLTKTVISDDADLGRYDEGKPKNAGKQRPKGIELIQHHLTLRSILKRLDDNCRVFGVAGDRYLLVKCNDAPTDAAGEYLFRIGFMQGIPPENIKEEHINISPKLKRKQPEWWKDVWGNFQDMLDHRFPVEYVKDMAASYEPLMIYAAKNKQDKLIPITSDMDLLWISRPERTNPLVVNVLEKHNIDIMEVINTFKEDGTGVKDMRKALEAICKIDEEKRLNLDSITDERLASIGCATPFEAYVIFVVNQRFAEYVNHLGDLLQHGADNRSPYAPSDIEKVLHIIGGEAILTENEKDLIKFMLERPDFVDEYDIDIHPEVSMKKWGKIIEKQIARFQDIQQRLMDHFLEDKYAESSPLARRASMGLETLKGTVRRLSLIASPQPGRKRSSPERKRTSSFSYINQENPRRASEPLIISPEPLIRLTKEFSDLYKEEEAFLGKYKQKCVIDFCASQNSDSSEWKWVMPMKGVIHANHRKNGEQIYFQLTNTSIDLHAQSMNDANAKALYELKQAICPDRGLKIIANDKNTEKYQQCLQRMETELKK